MPTLPRSRVSRLLLACLVACVPTLVAGRQSPPTPAGQANPQFKAAVNLVRVDVYATTGNRPVLDLAQNDFEVYEDGVLQKVESFEHIVARLPGPESERAEPRTDAEARDAVADPRTRLFVVFFDTLHTFGYQKNDQPTPLKYDPTTIGRNLATFLYRSIGADDLVALMHPEESLAALRFTRRPSRFEEFLLSGAEWQRRFLDMLADDVEKKYDTCYAPLDQRDIFVGMVARRREMRLLDTLRGLSVWLGALREGRKAVFVVSEGWELYRPDERLARPLNGTVPSPRGVGTMPRAMDPARDSRGNVDYQECERDRMMLSRLDNYRDFQSMLDEANRHGVSFYPIDIRGLTVEGTKNRRGDSLITLATATDGVAIVDTNNFTPALARINEDLASYYLLAYYSSNTKADGTFRKIEVKVKRPGVNLRSRRGYRAPTAAEGADLAKPAALPDPVAEVRARVLQQLDAEQPRQAVRIAPGYGWPGGAEGGAKPRPVVWVAGELDSEAARQPEWSEGGSLEVTLSDSTGSAFSTATASLSPSSRSFVVYLGGPQLAAGGDYLVRLRSDVRAAGVPAAPVTARLSVPADAGALTGTPLLFRAAAAARAPFAPAVQARFRRTERLRIVLPVGPTVVSISAQLLDRRGQPLQLPLTFALSEDGPVRAATGELRLSSLALGDYLVQCEAVAGTTRAQSLIAFRIVP